MQLFKITVKQENDNLLTIFNGNPESKQLIAEVTKEEKSQAAVVAPAVKKPEAKSDKKPDKKTTIKY